MIEMSLSENVHFDYNSVYSKCYRRELMKIASYNLSNNRALNIGVGGLPHHASAFTGFSSFLLSRGSMAAPAAK
jgi:hypothetical protein